MRKRLKNPFSDQAELSEVNVTPLADVSLTLLITLMIISPMVLQSLIQVQAAQAVATQTKAAVTEKPIFVDLTADGMTVNNQKIENEYQFFRTLQRNLATKQDKTVLISAGADVRYHRVVRALDIVKQSGAVSLSLVPRRDGKT